MWLWAETSLDPLLCPCTHSMPSCELTFRYTFFSHRQTHEEGTLTRCEHPHSWQQLLYFSPALFAGREISRPDEPMWNQNMAGSLPVTLAGFLVLKLGSRNYLQIWGGGLPRTVGSDYRCERKYWQPERGST